MRLYNILSSLIMCLVFTDTRAFESEASSELILSAKQQYKEGNYKSAITLLEQANSLGNPQAMLILSSMYRIGKAVAKDKVLADKYLQKAINEYKRLAKNDDSDAQYKLGSIYNHHTNPPKILEAYNWYLMAANNNHMEAQYKVAKILNSGELEPEIKKSTLDAIQWFEKSANQGYKLAIKALSKIDAQQTAPDYKKRVNLLWSTKEQCYEDGAFLIAIESYGDSYKVAACAKYGCRININEFGNRLHRGDYRDDPKLVWHSEKEFETKINGNNMRFYHCLTK